MKKFIFLLLVSFLSAANQEGPNDQLLVLFGSSGYVIHKVLDFANDHGYRYAKILSYEFTGFNHEIKGSSSQDGASLGRLFELNDDFSSISFLCFDEAPNDIYIIDLEKYRFLLNAVTLDKD